VLKKNQIGFSLINSLVVVGVVAGLVFLLLQSKSSKSKQDKSLKLQTEVAEITSLIRQTLSEKKACDATLIGMSPGDMLSALRTSPLPSQQFFAETGTKFKSTGLFIKEMRLLTRAEEVSGSYRNATVSAITNYSTGAGLTHLKVVLVEQLGVIKDPKQPEKFYKSKETDLIFPIQGFFYDVKIVTHNNKEKLHEACLANASSLDLTCLGAEKERCVTLPIDEDGNGTDYVVDPKTGSKSYLAECRYFKDDSPMMECSV
jgi:type II secretory pathway pseudopilin PulG